MVSIALDFKQPDEPRRTLRYTIVVEKKEDGAFVAKVPAMPGCIGQGKTTQEALENVRQAMILFIEDCRRSGKDIPREPDR